MGRTSIVTLDATERVTQVQVGINGSSLLPLQFGNDPNSSHLLSMTEQGTYVLADGGTSSAARQWRYGYDANGYLQSITDPVGRVISYVNDAVGRPTDVLLPEVDGGTRDLHMAYDSGLDDPVGVRLPRSTVEEHAFDYTPMGDPDLYSPPDPNLVDAGLDATVAGPWSTQYTYFNDRELKTETHPDGTTITRGYDGAGRLSTVNYPQGNVQWTYNDTPATVGVGHPASVVLAESSFTQGLGFGYDGPLLTSLTWTGTVGGSVTFGHYPGFLLASVAVNVGAPVIYHYDGDGLVTTAGVTLPSAISITRDPSNGLIKGASLGSVSDLYAPDLNGRFASYTSSLGSAFSYTETVARYADNRIAQKTESISGTGSGVQSETHFWQYSYDAAGRLMDVLRDSAHVSHYDYDADDNRVAFTNVSQATTKGSYDGQDRLVSYDAATTATTYAYGNNGELQSKTDATGTTRYTYDPFGNLLNVQLPAGGASIQYVIDGENRRVAKYSGTTLVVQYLYDDQNRVVAALAPGQPMAQFVYATRAHVPDYVISGSVTYRIVSDHLGSPRLIVNASIGAVVVQIDYDEFGNATVLSGQSVLPYLNPFGFAGGLYDSDTKLVRFGARDYDASVGRWIAKDPLRFGGGQSNLYVYVGNDPVNQTDPRGLDGNAGTLDLPLTWPWPLIWPVVAPYAVPGAFVLACGLLLESDEPKAKGPPKDCIARDAVWESWQGTPTLICTYECPDGTIFSTPGVTPAEIPCPPVANPNR